MGLDTSFISYNRNARTRKVTNGQRAVIGNAEPDWLKKRLHYKVVTDMKLAARALVLLVAIEHVGILILEMFFWDHPIGQRVFGMTPEVSAASATLAANQGLYNGFLAAGLFWGLFTGRRAVIIFFLGCVVVAGIFGGLTAKTSILLTQGAPAFIALLLLLVTRDGLETQVS